MKKLSKLFVALMVCVLAVGGLFSMAACGGGETEKDTIAVMAKGETHAFWVSVKEEPRGLARKWAIASPSAVPQTKAPLRCPSRSSR